MTHPLGPRRTLRGVQAKMHDGLEGMLQLWMLARWGL